MPPEVVVMAFSASSKKFVAANPRRTWADLIKIGSSAQAWQDAEMAGHLREVTSPLRHQPAAPGAPSPPDGAPPAGADSSEDEEGAEDEEGTRLAALGGRKRGRATAPKPKGGRGAGGKGKKRGREEVKSKEGKR
jgi:hypothetical protein